MIHHVIEYPNGRIAIQRHAPIFSGKVHLKTNCSELATEREQRIIEANLRRRRIRITVYAAVVFVAMFAIGTVTLT